MINAEQFYDDFLWVINKIKKEMAYRLDLHSWYEFVIEDKPKSPSRYKQYQVLQYLENFGLFKDFRIKGDSGKYDVPEEDEPAEAPAVILFKIDDEEFYKKALFLLKALQEKIVGKKEYLITLSEEDIKNEIEGITNSFLDRPQYIDGEIEFIDDTVTLKLIDRECQLPPYKNEHYLCRYIYSHIVNEPIQWDLAYKKMTGSKNQDLSGKEKKKLYDTIDRLNERVASNLGVKNWIKWENKSFKRTK